MCDKPYRKHDENNVMMEFNCGQCYPCIQRRASGWSYRLMKEGEVADLSLFVTLTYNTDNVPITKRGFMSLDRDKKVWSKKKNKMVFKGSHLTNFFKKLRKLTGKSIRYYAVGEYGGKTYRPHYHIILYNAEIQNVIDAWTNDNGHPLGDCHFGTVEGASIGYVLKYITKHKQIPLHDNDDRVPEYCRMSKGLGANYINDKTLQWHKADLENRQYMPLEDGKKCSMPRYYKQRIYTSQEAGYLKGSAERFKAKKEQEERQELADQYDHVIQQRKVDNWRKLKDKRQKNKNDLL